MNITKTADGIYKLSANMENLLFEGFWEMPNGVALNSYVVKGEKTALIDGFCGWEGVPETFFRALDEMDVPLETVDYIVINHMEPDHSGWIDNVRKIKEDVTIYCSVMGKKLLEAFYGRTENVITVTDGDTLDLGGGRILQFLSVPNVHWPDTIATFDTLSGTLFSCDMFGSYGVVGENGYDNLLSEEDILFYEREAVNYYSNVIGTFSSFAKTAIEKCRTLPVRIIAPGHGIVWRKDPLRICNDYASFAEHQENPTNHEITLLWASMYGMTGRAVKIIEKTLESSGVTYNVHNVAMDSWSIMLGSVWRSSGIILAMPTYEYNMFPPMAAILEEIGKKKARNRWAFRIGSYGWSGGAEKELAEINERLEMHWRFLPSVEFKGAPKEEDFKRLEAGTKDLVNCIEGQPGVC